MKKIALSIFLLYSVLLNFSGCTGVQAQDLMTGIKSKQINERIADERFINSQMYFSVELFKEISSQDETEELLISPMSLQLVLAMTANGADGETLAEMERLLGGDISLAELNEYLVSYTDNDNEEIKSANSIWIRDNENRINVEKSFLQTNADYYGAQAYKAPFDASTVTDINNWVNIHTKGRIDKMLDEIDRNTVMYLVNALTFDAKWQEKYEKDDIRSGIFHSPDTDQTVDMMHSQESAYLDDGRATGFIKPYEGGRYSFAAMLPNEDIGVDEYISGLTAEGLLKALKNNKGTVSVVMPKFKSEYDSKNSLNSVLMNLGMKKAFDIMNADFSRIDERNNLYISKVAQKTFIEVDENGTKAAALSFVENRDKAAMVTENKVVLDRPFVYMIIDNTTLLPVFMGTLSSVKSY